MSDIPKPPETLEENLSHPETRIRHCFWYANYETDILAAEALVTQLQDVYVQLLRKSITQEDADANLDNIVTTFVPSVVTVAELLEEINTTVGILKTYFKE
jgi:hypothetical protein